MRWRRESLLATAVLAFAVASAACSNQNTSVASSHRGPPTTLAIPRKGSILESPSLNLTITPTSGPPGTAIRIVVTGCNDPTGQNHAVSFNNNAEDVAARFDPNIVRLIPATQHGTSLAATYTVQAADMTGGAGLFFAQCGATTKTAPFSVVRTR